MSSLTIEKVRTCDGKLEGQEIELKFKHKPVKNTIFGSADKLEGAIKFLKPYGSHSIPHFLHLSTSEQDSWVTKYIEHAYELFDGCDEKDLEEKVRFCLLCAAHYVPNVGPESTLFQFCFDGVLALVYFDDIVDDMSTDLSDLKLTPKALIVRHSTFEKIGIDGELDQIKKVGLYFPFTKKCMDFLYETFLKTEKAYPDFRKNSKYGFLNLFNLMNTIPIVLNNQKSKAFGEESLKHFKGIQSGVELSLEFITGIQGVFVKDSIRQTIYFQKLLEKYTTCCGLFNDIVGLGRDIETGESRETPILRRVLNDGLSLQESFDELMKTLESDTREVESLLQFLREGFPNEAGLQEYLNTLEGIFDGQIYAYYKTAKLRYGEFDMEIVPKIST